MVCPKCHSETHVIKTIKFDSVVKRIRVCNHCYYSFTTAEELDETEVEVA